MINLSSKAKIRAIWIIAAVILAFIVCLLSIWKFGAVPFVHDVPGAATKVIGSLLVITLFTERSLAAINAAFFGADKKEYEAALRGHDAGVTLTPEQIKSARTGLTEIAIKEEAVRIAFGFCFAVLVSAGGVRTLAALLMIDGDDGMQDGNQKNLMHMVDIALTAGLIAGGSNGLAQLLQIIKDGLKPPPKLL